MIEVSPHARLKMAAKGISEEEIKDCIREGTLIAKQVVDSESRYAKCLELKDKKIVVVYVFRKGITRVITCYPIHKKKTW